MIRQVTMPECVCQGREEGDDSRCVGGWLGMPTALLFLTCSGMITAVAIAFALAKPYVAGFRRPKQHARCCAVTDSVAWWSQYDDMQVRPVETRSSLGWGFQRSGRRKVEGARSLCSSVAWSKPAAYTPRAPPPPRRRPRCPPTRSCRPSPTTRRATAANPASGAGSSAGRHVNRHLCSSTLKSVSRGRLYCTVLIPPSRRASFAP